MLCFVIEIYVVVIGYFPYEVAQFFITVFIANIAENMRIFLVFVLRKITLFTTIVVVSLVKAKDKLVIFNLSFISAISVAINVARVVKGMLSDILLLSALATLRPVVSVV